MLSRDEQSAAEDEKQRKDALERKALHIEQHKKQITQENEKLAHMLQVCPCVCSRTRMYVHTNFCLSKRVRAIVCLSACLCVFGVRAYVCVRVAECMCSHHVGRLAGRWVHACMRAYVFHLCPD